MEQVPSSKPANVIEAKATSNPGAKCCVCLRSYSSYLGQFKCGKGECAVPVIVCPARRCRNQASDFPSSLKCPLCRQGYKAPDLVPDLVGQKRKLGMLPSPSDRAHNDIACKKEEDNDGEGPVANGTNVVCNKATERLLRTTPSRRLFVGKLPLVITASTLRQSLCEALQPDMCAGNNEHKNDSHSVKAIEWIIDRNTRAFYGSAWVGVSSLDDAERLVTFCKKNGGIALTSSGTAHVKNKHKQKKARRSHDPVNRRRKKIWVAFAPLHDGESWPLPGHKYVEYPPMGW